MALTDFLHLPPSVSRSREQGRRVLVCTVPGCGAAFGLDQREKFARHARHCSDDNADRIDDVIAKHRESVFARPADKEAYDHFRKPGAT